MYKGQLEIVISLCILAGLTLFSSCQKCIECGRSRFNETERALVYEDRDTVRYSNGKDTIAVPVERTVSQSNDTECGTFPVRASCLSFGSVVLYSAIASSPIHSVERITTSKNNAVWTCTDFQIGDTFFLNCDENYKLSPRSNNDYEITTHSGYIFNQTNIGDVQEVQVAHPLGNVSELTRFVFHPMYGVLELTYSNPSDTWKQVP